jgi:hypothetical protein
LLTFLQPFFYLGNHLCIHFFCIQSVTSQLKVDSVEFTTQKLQQGFQLTVKIIHHQPNHNDQLTQVIIFLDDLPHQQTFDLLLNIVQNLFVEVAANQHALVQICDTLVHIL